MWAIHFGEYEGEGNLQWVDNYYIVVRENLDNILYILPIYSSLGDISDMKKS